MNRTPSILFLLSLSMAVLTLVQPSYSQPADIQQQLDELRDRLDAHFNGAQWSQCDEDYLFTIRSYADKGGFPGSVTRESLQTPSLKTGTGTLYAGVYELVQWEFEFNDSNIEHIGIQSESDGLNCWFLWLSSGEGDYSSSVNSGNGWTNEVYDLCICIDE
jgi:hypothetical protein